MQQSLFIFDDSNIGLFFVFCLVYTTHCFLVGIRLLVTIYKPMHDKSNFSKNGPLILTLIFFQTNEKGYNWFFFC